MLRSAGRGEAVRYRDWLARIDPAALTDAPASHALATIVAALWTELEVVTRWAQRWRELAGPQDLLGRYIEAVRAADTGWSSRAEELTPGVLDRLEHDASVSVGVVGLRGGSVEGALVHVDGRAA